MMDNAATLEKPTKKTLAKRYGAFKRLPGEGVDPAFAPKLVFGTEESSSPAVTPSPVESPRSPAVEALIQETGAIVAASREQRVEPVAETAPVVAEAPAVAAPQENAMTDVVFEPSAVLQSAPAMMPKINRRPREKFPRLYHVENPLQDVDVDTTPDVVQAESVPRSIKARDVRIGLVLVVMVVALNALGIYLLDWKDEPATSAVDAGPVLPAPTPRDVIQQTREPVTATVAPAPVVQQAPVVAQPAPLPVESVRQVPVATVPSVRPAPAYVRPAPVQHRAPQPAPQRQAPARSSGLDDKNLLNILSGK